MAKTEQPALCALLTTFNRREKTLACLRELALSAGKAGIELSAVLVDDGSRDGTAAAVRAEFQWVTVVEATGSLYWCRGMHMAMSHAIANTSSTTPLLWLNDDTNLHPDALARLFETAEWITQKFGKPGIVVGSTCDASTGKLTYGGSVAPDRWRPFRYVKVHSMSEPVPCDTLNGNVVLIPRAVISDIGLIDAEFEHASGDTDYGLRANRRGHPVYVAPGFVGTCSNNPITGTFNDPALGLRKRMKLMLDRKGLPWRSWLVLTRRHGGTLWPLYFVWPYLRLLVASSFNRSASN